MENKAKKFKGLATLIWDFESEGDNNQANKEAIAYLEGILAKYVPDAIRAGWGVKVRVQPIVEKLPKRIVLGEIPVANVLDHISEEPKAEREYIADGLPYMVKMSSLRYQVFKRDHCTCVCCGLVGTRMVLEKGRHVPRPHFNLYGIEDGREVLFTKDHIIPVAHGGTEKLENLQTMCCICNLLKGCAKELSMEGLFKMRQVYRQNIKEGEVITNIRLKQMKLGVAEEEAFAAKRARELNTILAKEKARHDALRFVDDVQVWAVPEGGFVGLPTTMKRTPKKAVRVADGLFARGTVVKPVRARNDKIHVAFNDEGKYCRVFQALLDYVVEDKTNGEAAEARPEGGSDCQEGR